MSQNPRLDLNIVPAYWKRIPQRELSGALAKLGEKYGRSVWHYVPDNLRELGLAVYRNPFTDGLLVGFTNTKQPVHDRWVFTTHDSPDGLLWLRASKEGLRRMLAYGTLAQALNDLRLAVQHAGAYGAQDMPMPVVLRRLQLLDFKPDAINALPENLTLQTMHRMLHHYPQWVACSPEFKDMPAEIVLRMHGLGAVLDAGHQLEGA